MTSGRVRSSSPSRGSGPTARTSSGRRSEGRDRRDRFGGGRLERSPGRVFPKSRSSSWTPWKPLVTWPGPSAPPRGIPLVGITGSSGKTTAKEMLFSLLSRSAACCGTRKPEQPDRDAPWRCSNCPGARRGDPRDGLQRAGGDRAWPAIASPDIGVITNIAPRTSKGFRTMEGVAREKGTSTAALAAPAPRWSTRPTSASSGRRAVAAPRRSTSASR